MNQNFDEIIINLPKKAEYVGFIRLAVSGLVSRIGFDIDTVEDIKVVVSEICTRIVSSGCDSGRYYDVRFKLFDEGFQAFFKVPNCLAGNLFEGDSGDFAKAIISSLTDEFSITCNDDDCIITIGKNLGDSING